MYFNIRKLMIGLCIMMPGICYSVISAQDNTPNAAETNAANSCACHYDCNNKNNHKPKKGLVQIATDNNGNPVNIAYVAQGKQRYNYIPTIIFMDPYLGSSGWACQQNKFSKHFFTLALDPLGSGNSSTPLPTDLDGVEGQAGYSFDQQAIFLHNFLQNLNITSPIIIVAVDTQGEVAVKYTNLYANDPLAISKLVLINASAQSIVSDDPCQLAYLSVEQAQQLIALYNIDPCAAVCSLLATSFTDPACPTAAKDVYNECVNYFGHQPAALFERFFTQTFTEDISPLLAQITIPTLYLYSVVDNNDLISRKAQGLYFTGYCPNCVTGCTTGVEVQPVPDCRFISFPGHGTLVHRTAAKVVNRSIKEFILGCDLECCPCPIKPDVPVVCPIC